MIKGKYQERSYPVEFGEYDVGFVYSSTFEEGAVKVVIKNNCVKQALKERRL